MRPEESRSTRVLAALSLLAFVAVGIALTASWMHDNGFFGRPPCEDAGYYRAWIGQLMRGFEKGGALGWGTSVLDLHSHQPPFEIAIASLVSIWRGECDSFTMWITQALFWALLGEGVRRLARNFLGPWQSAAASALALTCPVVLCNMRVMFFQLPMTALVVWSLDALIRSRRFTATGWVIVSAIFAGLATMTKNLGPLYLGGPALVAVGLGFWQRGSRIRVLGNLLLALATVAAITAPWYLRHYEAVLEYANHVAGSGGQVEFSRGLPWYSGERWLYYPLNLVNNGFAFPVACLVALAIVLQLLIYPIAALFDSRMKPRLDQRGSDGVWILVACVATTLPTLTLGQVSGYSAYVMLYVPLGALLLVGAVARIPRPGPRWVFGILVAAAGLWTGVLGYRSLDEDITTRRFGRLDLIGQADWYVIQPSRWVAAVARPDAEIWPVREFTEMMIRERRKATIKIAAGRAFSHPLVNIGNLDYEAERFNRQVVATEPQGGPSASDEEIDTFLREVEFFIIDSALKARNELFYPVERMKVRVRELGFDLREIAAVNATPNSRLQLLQLRRPWERPRWTTVEALDQAGIAKVDADLEGGVKLVGVEVGSTQGTPLFVHTFWSLPDSPIQNLRVYVEAWVGNERVATVSNYLDGLRLPNGQGTLRTVGFEFNAPRAKARTDIRIVVERVREVEMIPRDWVKVTKTSLKTNGRFQVIFIPAS